MPVVAALLAHQGGWDEMLLIAGPIAVIVGVLIVVKRRVGAHEGEFGESRFAEDRFGEDARAEPEPGAATIEEPGGDQHDDPSER